MAGKSRWADDEEDAQLEAQRKLEKEEKKRAKAEKQRKAEEAAALEKQRQEALAAQAAQDGAGDSMELSNRPAKRRKLSPEPSVNGAQTQDAPRKFLRFEAPGWKPCRSVEDFEKLNDIEEGAYGWVSRAKDTLSGKVVALKRLKMENAQDGVPVTGLREIQTLRDCSHQNIVRLQEVVIGEDRSKVEK